MNHIITVLLFVILCFVNVANAQEVPDFQQSKSGWDAELGIIQQAIPELARKDSVEIATFKDNLRLIKLQTEEWMLRLNAELNAENALLQAVGENVAAKDKEATEIAKQRAAIESRIASIDTRIRSARLTAAKADDYLVTIEKWEQEQLRNQLLAHHGYLWNLDIPALIADVERYIQDFTEIRKAVLLLLGLFAVIAAGYAVTDFLNRWFAEPDAIMLMRPFSKSQVVGVVSFAYITTLLRFNILSMTGYVMLADVFGIIASTYLAVVMLLMLLRLRFVTPQQEKDVLLRNDDKRDMAWLIKLFIRLAESALIAIPFVALAGYVNLALYLSLNVFMTLFACFMFVWVRSIAVRSNNWLHRHVHKDVQESEKDKDTLSPVAITIIEPLLAFMGVALAAFFWGTTAEDVQSWLLQLQSGIKIGDITIHLPAIGEGIVLFLVLYTITKIVQWFIISRVFPNTSLDKGLQHAVITVTGYVGNITALLLALGAIGLNMSNLAIIAGALSVGIGFGLQAVFNNFVSGLILLFERPFKVGDWIVTNTHQGYIKKIRVRSTEIETFQNASVIVPNSMLISETVANWTLHNNVGRIEISVKVAYGSDTRLVQKVLLDVAKAHDQIRSYPKPHVLFMDFGESALNFELRCFVRNIGDSFSVSSDLRFAIDEAFRKHGIEIPFPQRDVHIRSGMESLKAVEEAIGKAAD